MAMLAASRISYFPRIERLGAKGFNCKHARALAAILRPQNLAFKAGERRVGSPETEEREP